MITSTPLRPVGGGASAPNRRSAAAVPGWRSTGGVWHRDGEAPLAPPLTSAHHLRHLKAAAAGGGSAGQPATSAPGASALPPLVTSALEGGASARPAAGGSAALTGCSTGASRSAATGVSGAAQALLRPIPPATAAQLTPHEGTTQMTTATTGTPADRKAHQFAAYGTVTLMAAFVLAVLIGAGMGLGWVNTPIRVVGCSIAAAALLLAGVFHYLAERADRAQ